MNDCTIYVGVDALKYYDNSPTSVFMNEERWPHNSNQSAHPLSPQMNPRTSIPSSPTPPTCWFLLESPRWELSADDTDDEESSTSTCVSSSESTLAPSDNEAEPGAVWCLSKKVATASFIHPRHKSADAEESALSKLMKEIEDKELHRLNFASRLEQHMRDFNWSNARRCGKGLSIPRKRGILHAPLPGSREKPTHRILNPHARRIKFERKTGGLKGPLPSKTKRRTSKATRSSPP